MDAFRKQLTQGVRRAAQAARPKDKQAAIEAALVRRLVKSISRNLDVNFARSKNEKNNKNPSGV